MSLNPDVLNPTHCRKMALGRLDLGDKFVQSISADSYRVPPSTVVSVTVVVVVVVVVAAAVVVAVLVVAVVVSVVVLLLSSYLAKILHPVAELPRYLHPPSVCMNTLGQVTLLLCLC